MRNQNIIQPIAIKVCMFFGLSFKSLMLIILLTTAIISLSEIISRDHRLKIYRSDIVDIEKEILFEKSKKLNYSVFYNRGSMLSIQDNMNSVINYYSELTKLTGKDSNKLHIQSIKNNLNKLKFSIDKVISVYEINFSLNENFKSEKTVEMKERIDEMEKHIELIYYGISTESYIKKYIDDRAVVNWLTYSSSFIQSKSTITLLGILMVIAGVIGAIVTEIRISNKTDKDGLVRGTVLGMSSGFILYLVVKGDMLMSIDSTIIVPVNPYACTLLAMFSGMFSRPLYDYIAYFVDDLSSKLKEKIT